MPLQDIVLYYAPGACSLAPHILLHETGLPFRTVAATINESETSFPEGYRRINPKMRVPAVVIGSDIITEARAVCAAISELKSHLGIMGSTSGEKIQVLEWFAWLSTALHSQGFGHLFRPLRFSDDPGSSESIQAKARLSIAETFRMTEERFETDHAVGSVFTGVDAYLFVFFLWGNLYGFDTENAYPK